MTTRPTRADQAAALEGKLDANRRHVEHLAALVDDLTRRVGAAEENLAGLVTAVGLVTDRHVERLDDLTAFVSALVAGGSRDD
jgi:hypothetical protein